MRTDKYPCDRCASMVIGDNARQLDGGLLLIVHDYYGGFSDNYADPPVEVALCHECAVSLAHAVPKVAELAPRVVLTESKAQTLEEFQAECAEMIRRAKETYTPYEED